jgi:diphosphomevalonate decarboxylase
MTKQDCVRTLLADRGGKPLASAEAYAPANIALCKYWGKRDEELNLPETSSLSVSLGRLGTRTRVSVTEGPLDLVVLNGQPVDTNDPFATRLRAFLDLFRSSPDQRFRVATENTIPTAAGLASSASGFAALTLALNELMGWELNPRDLSILARLGSGSASRSIHEGFVEWHRGNQDDGMDSYAEPLSLPWPGFRIATVTVCDAAKPISSRAAMRRTRASARLYEAWPLKVADDLMEIRSAIRDRDFAALGRTAESNALSMHATMIASWPPVVYWLPESLAVMRRVWGLRDAGLPLYFTMDAGPNLKLLFEAADQETTKSAFPGCTIIAPCENLKPET